MIFTHFFQLLLHYRALALKVAIGITGSVCLLSLLLLISFPIYKGKAIVSMLPTEAELSYTKGWLGQSQFNPNNIMVQTHIENLLSRPVMEKTLAKILEQYDPEFVAPGGLVKDVISGLKAAFWTTYNVLNYGKHVPVDPYEDLLNQLMKGIDIEAVEGTLILEIEASTLYQSVSAIAANELAAAYVERVHDDMDRAAVALRNYLKQQIDQRETALSEVENEALAKRSELNVLNLEEERSSLLTARETERAKLEDAQAALIIFDSKIKSLRAEQSVLRRQGGVGVAGEVDRELAMAQTNRQGLSQMVALREENVKRYDNQLAQLAKNEKALQAFDRRKERLENDIVSLQDRLVTVDLSQARALSQVRVLNPAIEPVYPAFPKVLVFTIVGGVASVFVIAFLLVLLDTTSQTIKTELDMRRLVGDRFLGYLPAKSLDEEAISARSKEKAQAVVKRFERTAGLALVRKVLFASEATIKHETSVRLVQSAETDNDSKSLPACAPELTESSLSTAVIGLGFDGESLPKKAQDIFEKSTEAVGKILERLLGNPVAVLADLNLKNTLATDVRDRDVLVVTLIAGQVKEEQLMALAAQNESTKQEIFYVLLAA